MQWKDVGKLVGQYAPLLGDLLPIPYAGVAGKLIASAFSVENTPDAIHNAIKSDPDAAIKLAKLELDNKALLQKQMLAAETGRIQSINKTMQDESKSEHWAQWMWRPFVGFIFGITFIGVYFILPLAKIEVPLIPSEAWMMIGAVLGVASWHRGAAKVEQAKK
ncbi:MAG: hypothetical protein JKY80_02010 [Mariprofundaceae bacterium]|nr:hypothetical protein [Methylophaga sp.]MBL4759615.1 hypothetical protein [Mariprofundaceae bacterium]